MVGDAEVTLVKDAYAAFGRGDVDAIVAATTPDVRWEMVGQRSHFAAFGPRQGREGVRDFFRILAENDEYEAFTPETFAPAGDRLFVLGHVAGKVKRTGKPIASDWVQVFEFRDGLISSWREFIDTGQIADANRH